MRTSDSVVFTFGRFNPPTKGHVHLLESMVGYDSNSDVMVFTSASKNDKNPLDYDTKLKMMDHVFRSHVDSKFEIVNDKSINTMFNALVHLYDKGYKYITLLVGSDRVKEHIRQIPKYNDVESKHGYYSFEEITILSVGDRDNDAVKISGVSSTRVRQTVIDKDYDKFCSMYDNEEYCCTLFELLSKEMINNVSSHISY